MLQSVAYVARIRNGYSGRNGAGQAVTGQDDVDRIRAFGVADGAALQASQARAAAAPRGPCRSRSRGVGAVLVGLFGISPGVMLESRQARCDEGEIICPGNQKTEIEKSKPRLPWVLRRHCDCPLATIDHGRSEAAVGSTAPGFGSDVIGANDQVQARFRHINPHICDRRSPCYRLDNCDEMFAFGETSG